MQLNNRIKQIRKERQLSRRELYQRLFNVFGKDTIKPNSIWRIESGLTNPQASSLHQLCIGLDISLRELLQNVLQESKLVDIVKSSKRLDQFAYNELAHAEVLSSSKMPFLAQELILLPGGKTNLEEDPIEIGKFQKWIHCLRGELNCYIGTEKHTLKKGDSLSFESNLPHYFENNSSRKTRCIIVQNPKHI
ncbi:MAG: helix-turn-helix transcriptional regulator [Candidatus Omnitrophica bacterium]|nr:helix-turn-helix transcriptional regulator [Candidatus Omnitrophota bacterium]